MTNGLVPLGLSLLAGLILGALFFGGLWWTVYRCVSSRQPALVLFASLVLRMGLVLTGFYLVGAAHWERLLACLLGFFIARLLVTRLTRAPRALSILPATKAGHAP